MNETTLEQLTMSTDKILEQTVLTRNQADQFRSLSQTMQSLKAEFNRFQELAQDISANSRIIQNTTTDFAAVIEESTAAIEEINANLHSITDENKRVYDYLHATTEAAEGLAR